MNKDELVIYFKNDPTVESLRVKDDKKNVEKANLLAYIQTGIAKNEITHGVSLPLLRGQGFEPTEYEFYTKKVFKKNVIRLVAVDGAFCTKDKAALDSMSKIVTKQHNYIKQKLNKKFKVCYTILGISATLIFTKLALKIDAAKNATNTYNQIMERQESYAKQNIERAQDGRAQLDMFGEELPKSTDEINDLYAIFEENIAEAVKIKGIDEVLAKRVAHTELTPQEKGIYSDYYNQLHNIKEQSEDEYENIKSNGVIK